MLEALDQLLRDNPVGLLFVILAAAAAPSGCIMPGGA